MVNYSVVGKINPPYKLGKFQVSDGVEFSKYITSVNNQRKLNPKFPKLDDLLPYTFLSSYSTSDLIKLIKSSSYKYIGVKNINLQRHWEFALKGSTFESTQFIYIPVLTEYRDELTVDFYGLSPAEFIPSFSTLDVEAGVFPISYPLGQNLFFYNPRALSSYYQLTLPSDLTHPLLPDFYSTGKTFLLSNQLYYEYFDDEGLYGPKYLTYISALRPFNLDFPKGLPPIEDIVIKECFIADIGKLPLTSLPWETGTFTGYVYYEDVQPFIDSQILPAEGNTRFILPTQAPTTDKTTFYIYKRPDNTLYATPVGPSSKFSLAQQEPTVEINISNSTHSLSIDQISPPATIEIVIESI